MNMNTFYIILTAFFLSCCTTGQSEPSKKPLDGDADNSTESNIHSQTHEINHIRAITHFHIREKLGCNFIISPYLNAPATDRYQWYIKIHLNGEDNNNDTISVAVCLSSLSAVEEATAEADISIINNKKEVLLSRYLTTRRYECGSTTRCSGWQNFCNKDGYFRNHLLQNDTLTFSIHIKWLSESPTEVIQGNVSSTSATPETTAIKFNFTDSNVENSTRSDTYLPTHEINHIWAIHQFGFHEKLEHNQIDSPILQAPTTDRYKWQIKIYPNGEDYNNDTISVFVCLSDDSAIKETTAQANFLIINDKKEALHRRYFTPIKYVRGSNKACCGWPCFRKKDDYFRNHLLQNDTLILSIHIKWLSEPPQNFESKLENPKSADVIFITNGSNYPAHKNILAARSPIFDSMFQRKRSKNGKSKKIRINVTHMDEKVLRAMLRYIYTGKCEQLGELTDRLFEAATKYGVNGLRETCEKTQNKIMLG